MKAPRARICRDIHRPTGVPEQAPRPQGDAGSTIAGTSRRNGDRGRPARTGHSTPRIGVGPRSEQPTGAQGSRRTGLTGEGEPGGCRSAPQSNGKTAPAAVRRDAPGGLRRDGRLCVRRPPSARPRKPSNYSTPETGTSLARRFKPNSTPTNPADRTAIRDIDPTRHSAGASHFGWHARPTGGHVVRLGVLEALKHMAATRGYATRRRFRHPFWDAPVVAGSVTD